MFPILSLQFNNCTLEMESRTLEVKKHMFIFPSSTCSHLSHPCKVKLVSEFVRPDLELSDASIDFGHVPVGQVKRITMKFPELNGGVVGLWIDGWGGVDVSRWHSRTFFFVTSTATGIFREGTV